MKLSGPIALVCLAAACGGEVEPCTVVDNGSSATISCPDGTSATINDGAAGANGTNGTNGVNGGDEVLALVQSLKTSYGSAVLDFWCYVGGVVNRKGTATKTATGTLITSVPLAQGCEQTDFYAGGTLVGGGYAASAPMGARDILEATGVVWNTAGLAIVGVPRAAGWTPVLGGLVVSLNYPADIRNGVQASTGHVVDENAQESAADPVKWERAFTADYAAADGSYGAPVFDKNGHWVGIHVGGYLTGGAELDWALPF